MPHNVYGHLEGLGVPADEPLLADDDVRWKGQPIAAVAAESEEAAQAAVDAIEIEFEEREPVLDIRTAADPGGASTSTSGARSIRTSARTTTAACARATSTRPSTRPT